MKVDRCGECKLERVGNNPLNMGKPKEKITMKKKQKKRKKDRRSTDTWRVGEMDIVQRSKQLGQHLEGER